MELNSETLFSHWKINGHRQYGHLIGKWGQNEGRIEFKAGRGGIWPEEWPSDRKLAQKCPHMPGSALPILNPVWSRYKEKLQSIISSILWYGAPSNKYEYDLRPTSSTIHYSYVCLGSALCPGTWKSVFNAYANKSNAKKANSIFLFVHIEKKTTIIFR